MGKPTRDVIDAEARLTAPAHRGVFAALRTPPGPRAGSLAGGRGWRRIEESDDLAVSPGGAVRKAQSCTDRKLP
jgi:hypothetical protein